VHALSAYALCAFDRSGLRDILPDGREQLAALAAQMREVEGLQVTVVGHADRLGSDAYNQALSERRALTVRELLVGEGVPAGSITAYGRGSLLPVTICDAGLARDALIDCLRPDRRVEIEVRAAP